MSEQSPKDQLDLASAPFNEEQRECMVAATEPMGQAATGEGESQQQGEAHIKF